MIAVTLMMMMMPLMMTMMIAVTVTMLPMITLHIFQSTATPLSIPHIIDDCRALRNERDSCQIFSYNVLFEMMIITPW